MRLLHVLFLIGLCLNVSVRGQSQCYVCEHCADVLTDDMLTYCPPRALTPIVQVPTEHINTTEGSPANPSAPSSAEGSPANPSAPSSAEGSPTNPSTASSTAAPPEVPSNQTNTEASPTNPSAALNTEAVPTNPGNANAEGSTVMPTTNSNTEGLTGNTNTNSSAGELSLTKDSALVERQSPMRKRSVDKLLGQYRNKRSARSAVDQDPPSFHCYRIEVQVDGETKFNRGCIDVAQDQEACDAVKAKLTGQSPTNCHVCSTDKCNGAMATTISRLLLSVGALLLILSSKLY